MKKCTICGVEKDLSFFYKRSGRPSSYVSACKECTSKKAKKYRKENKEYKGLKENLERFKNDLTDEKMRLLFSIAYKQGYDQALTIPDVVVRYLAMEANEKKLIQLRTKLEIYKKLDKKLDKILNAEIEIEDYGNEIYGKIQRLENELTDLKCEMDLPDDRWDEDESA